MDELDKLKRAKLYMSQLAEGIDPISGMEMPGDTVMNNVRLARCFFYVAEVLQQVIDNGGQVRRIAPAKTSFVLDEAKLNAIPVSETPLTVTWFCRNITEAAAIRGKLSFSPITKWLLAEGYLRDEAVDEKKTRRRVTERGMELGLAEEERDSLDGRYLAILYNAAAQRFIINNLPAILGQGEG